jgi:hypothetical protein
VGKWGDFSSVGGETQWERGLPVGLGWTGARLEIVGQHELTSISAVFGRAEDEDGIELLPLRDFLDEVEHGTLFP